MTMSAREEVLKTEPTAKCVPNNYKNHSPGLNFAIHYNEWMALSAWKVTEHDAWLEAAQRVRERATSPAAGEVRQEKYPCPVCDFEMPDPANEYNICPRCGTEFENDDESKTHAELRAEWIAKGSPTFFTAPLPDPASNAAGPEELQPNKERAGVMRSNPVIAAWIAEFQQDKWNQHKDCRFCGWPHSEYVMCGYGATFGSVWLGGNRYSIHAGNVEFMLDFVSKLGLGFHWNREIFFDVREGNVIVTHLDQYNDSPQVKKWIIPLLEWQSISEFVLRAAPSTPVRPSQPEKLVVGPDWVGNGTGYETESARDARIAAGPPKAQELPPWDERCKTLIDPKLSDRWNLEAKLECRERQLLETRAALDAATKERESWKFTAEEYRAQFDRAKAQIAELTK